MAKYVIHKNIGRVRVAVTLGNRYTVWNGKQGRGEFVIPCHNRKQAEEIAAIINNKQHNGEIEVN
jgi:hypothetical protein